MDVWDTGIKVVGAVVVFWAVLLACGWAWRCGEREQQRDLGRRR
jgi:hypothetical protein